MTIKIRTWLILFLLTCLSFLIWLKYSHPLISDINLSINRSEAKQITRDYITQERKEDLTGFISATVFTIDYQADRYLQKNLGFVKEKEFLAEHDFELFHWVTRLFKEKENEEYIVAVSPHTGQIIGFRHKIDEVAARRKVSRKESKEKIIGFLTEKFDFSLDNYIEKSDLVTDRDNRSDHGMAFYKNNVFVPWTNDPNERGAKLIMGAAVSGDEILGFSKGSLDIPESFNRHVEIQKNTGQNLLTVIRICYLILFAASVFFLIIRRNHLAMHLTKKFYIYICVFLIIITFLADLNLFEHILKGYDTTKPFDHYMIRFFINALITIIFSTVGILMPSLSGEALTFEMFPKRKHMAFLHYVRTTFFSREVFYLIGIGYLAAIIMIGLQSLIFEFGRTHCGVWLEHTWLTKQSSAYLPFLAAFVISINASIFEEVVFRLFAISWLKKIFKSTTAAVIISSLLWGFGHSAYLIFPMWFRGLEVTILGLFLSFIYLRFGIISVIVAHYLFDAFWSTIAYLIGTCPPFYFYTSIFVLLLPLLFGIYAYIKNEEKEENPLKWELNNHQLFNLSVLKNYLAKSDISGKSTEELRKEIIGHGWDVAVVDVALEELQKPQLKQGESPK